MTANFSPREIVSELDRFIVGQQEAKKAVAIALRNRWRRMQLSERLREEMNIPDSDHRIFYDPQHDLEDDDDCDDDHCDCDHEHCDCDHEHEHCGCEHDHCDCGHNH